MNEGPVKPVRPAALEPGDMIGIAAPASPFDREAYDRGVSVLESMGFKTFSPEAIFLKDRYLAGSDRQRAETINGLFADRSVKAIFCARGGFGSLRALPYLDFTAIRNNPKIFVGFSDVTAILSALYTRCNLVTFHGPMVTTLGEANRATKDALRSALSSGECFQVSPQKAVTVKPGMAHGRITGGNLTTLCHLVGTRFSPANAGHILFLEDRAEPLYRIDRMLTQMRFAGFFDDIVGLALGSFEQCDGLDDLYGVVGDLFADRSIPILAGFDIGHGADNVTIPVGIEATLDTEARALVFHEPPTRSSRGL